MCDRQDPAFQLALRTFIRRANALAPGIVESEKDGIWISYRLRQDLARHTRQLLSQLIKYPHTVTGRRGRERSTVLFVCVHNAGRSQMAAGFLRRYAFDRIEVLSAGSEPADRINATAVAAMAEKGIDISNGEPKLISDAAVGSADVVITMGCGDACPIFPGRRYEDWELEDPAGRSIEEVRLIRDEIERRVRRLVAELS